MSGGFLHSLKSMYREVSCSIKLNSQLTDWFPINNGVKQGCLLSPTLFSLYIDDLVDELNSARAGIDINSDHVAALLYADDIVLLAHNEESLQLELDIVYNWCKTWGISINISKTKVMHFRKKHHLRDRAKHIFKVGANQLEYSHDYRYLGLYINEHLDWSETLEHIVSNAQKALTLLNHSTRCAGGFHFETYSLLFTQLVQSKILTNACIWGHKDYRRINSLQTQAMRFFLGVGNTCPNIGLFGEMGWVPIRAYIRERVLKFWKRLSNMEPHRLTHKIFLWSKSLSEQGFNNWTSRTQRLISDVGVTDVTQVPGPVLWESVAAVEFQGWLDDLHKQPTDSESGGRLTLYKLYKTCPKPEEYILKTISLNRRRTIAQIRCGCLPLELETGRYRNPKTPLSQRICQLCNSDVEDETHFLTLCPMLNHIRIHLFKDMQNIIPGFLSLQPIEK